jgi:hypothetical protein
MKRFLRDVGAFLALQVVVAVAVETAYHRALGAHNYMAAFEDKAKLLETTPPPRILLVGGSSLAFGVNSAAIERALGRPVVNLGLHAGLGLDLALRQAERSLAQGDLVVLSPEYGPLGPGLPFHTVTLLHQLAIVPSAARDLHVSSVPRLLDGGLGLPRQRLTALWDYVRVGRPVSVYWREGFNRRGDFLGHLDSGSLGGGSEHVWVPTAELATDACARLGRFARRARERGAEVLIAPPPIPADDRERQSETIARFWQAVTQRTGLRVLEDVVLPRSRFFDSGYHLTRQGRRQHTGSILRGVRAAGVVTRDAPAAPVASPRTAQPGR